MVEEKIVEEKIVKPWFQSKIIWINALALVAAGLDSVLEFGMVHPKFTSFILIGSCTANVLLRFVTYAPIVASNE